VSDIDAKIELTFKLYYQPNFSFNFKKDGKITKEDVRLVLSYAPIRQKSELVQIKEGNYSFEQGRS